jgi:hypothetical protein
VLNSKSLICQSFWCIQLKSVPRKFWPNEISSNEISHSKNDSVESTFLRRRINVNSHTKSFYDSYSWFYCILHRFYVSGVGLYGKNNYLPDEDSNPRLGLIFGIKTPNRIRSRLFELLKDELLNGHMNNIMDLIDFWKRTEYVLAVVNLTTWFFVCTLYRLYIHANRRNTICYKPIWPLTYLKTF